MGWRSLLYTQHTTPSQVGKGSTMCASFLCILRRNRNKGTESSLDLVEFGDDIIITNLNWYPLVHKSIRFSIRLIAPEIELAI